MDQTNNINNLLSSDFSDIPDSTNNIIPTEPNKSVTIGPKNHRPAFAEIIESSLRTWKAQCWQWDQYASFGSLVTIETNQTGRTLFGIVYDIQTGSNDSSRTPFAYKKTEKELRLEQPQIFDFLRSTVTCITIGFLENNKIFYQLAPEPPKIHAFVTPATPKQYSQFFSSTAYLPLLFQAPEIISLDDLLLALLHEQSKQKLLTEEKLRDLIETLTLLTANDYRRIKILLERAQLLI